MPPPSEGPWILPAPEGRGSRRRVGTSVASGGPSGGLRIWIYLVLLLHVLSGGPRIWIYLVLLLHVLSDESATLCICCK
jgi:hypothetical protein